MDIEQSFGHFFDPTIPIQFPPIAPATPEVRECQDSQHQFVPIQLIRETKGYINGHGVKMERFEDFCLNECSKCGVHRKFKVL